MSTPFLAEIRIFGANFAPTGWAFCDGQLLPISQNTALFSLLGTYYGGDGRVTFALPDLRGRVPMFWGAAPGATQHALGEQGGEPQVTLTEAQVPAHVHALAGSPRPAALGAPAPQTSLGRSNPPLYKQPAGAAAPAPLAPGTIGATGGGQPHNNLMPYAALNFCIALQGIYPPRS